MKKWICYLCMLALLVGMLAACGSGTGSVPGSEVPAESSQEQAPSSPEEAPEAVEAPVPEEEPPAEPELPPESAEDPSEPETPAAEEASAKEYATVEFPYSDTNVHLTYMLPAPNVPEGYGIAGYSDFLTVQQLNEKSNVDMEFLEVSFFTYGEQFNLVCASSDLPDILYGVSSYYAAGLTAAEEQGIIIPINDYLETYAPDYLRCLEEKDLLKSVKNDEGDILQFSQTLDSLAQKSGGVIRSDWLDALGMEVPTTIDQLEQVLYAFQTEYDCAQPLYMTSTQPGANLIYAYGIPADGVSNCMFQNDGVVDAVYNTAALKDYLTLLNQWYTDNLFTHDYMTIVYDPFAQAERVLLADNDVGVWNANLNDLNAYGDVTESGFALEPLPSMVLSEGDTLHCSPLSYQEVSSVSITSGSEKPEIAAMWLNYWFTDEGYMAYNYGVEGETYELVNGEVQFTSLVTENEYGLTANQMLRLYCLAGQMPGYQAQKRTAVFYDDVQNKAWDVWTDSLGDNANLIPSGLSLTADESAEYANVMSDIMTYAAENIPRFVMGDRPLSQWEDFVAEVNSMNLARGIEIYQAALDRYNARRGSRFLTDSFPLIQR